MQVGDISPAIRDVVEEHMRMVNICRLQLIRKRQDKQQEFVPRPGLLVPAAEVVKCIFGYKLEMDGCLEKASNICVECGAFCCDLHHLHSTHHDANSSDILRQQITAAAANSSRTTDPAVASSSSSTNTIKAPARNTRSDLSQRFLAVTGRQTIDSKHKALKVKEFQLIVEGLERAATQSAATSINAANNAIAPTNQNVANASTIQNISSSIPLDSLPAATTMPANLSDELVSSFLRTIIQSNPVLRDQMFSIMQSCGSEAVSLNNQECTSRPEHRIEEASSDDDNTFC
jgi:hypothetical protein